jgi:hypothetical protein
MTPRSRLFPLTSRRLPSGMLAGKPNVEEDLVEEDL